METAFLLVVLILGGLFVWFIHSINETEYQRIELHSAVFRVTNNRATANEIINTEISNVSFRKHMIYVFFGMDISSLYPKYLVDEIDV